MAFSAAPNYSSFHLFIPALPPLCLRAFVATLPGPVRLHLARVAKQP